MHRFSQTSPRNHNVSLVAASPTRHPGPLLCGCVRKRAERNGKKKDKKKPRWLSRAERLRISWAAAGSRTPLRRWLRRRLRVRRSASASPSHRAANTTEAGNHTRLCAFSRRTSGSMNVTWPEFSALVPRGFCRSDRHRSSRRDTSRSRGEEPPPALLAFACTAVSRLRVCLRAHVCSYVCVAKFR